MEPLLTRIVGSAIADIVARLGPQTNLKQPKSQTPASYKTKGRGRPPK